MIQKFEFLKYFLLLFGSFGVNIMGKTVGLSLKAIKTTGRPYIGQLCNLLSGTQFIVIFVFQYY